MLQFGKNFVTTTQISRGVPFVTLGGTFSDADRPTLAEAPICEHPLRYLKDLPESGFTMVAKLWSYKRLYPMAPLNTGF